MRVVPVGEQKLGRTAEALTRFYLSTSSSDRLRRTLNTLADDW